MQVAIELPDELIEEAMSATNVKEKADVIVIALQELVKKNKLTQLKDYKGQIDLEVDLDALRGRNVSSD